MQPTPYYKIPHPPVDPQAPPLPRPPTPPPRRLPLAPQRAQLRQSQPSPPSRRNTTTRRRGRWRRAQAATRRAPLVGERRVPVGGEALRLQRGLRRQGRVGPRDLPPAPRLEEVGPKVAEVKALNFVLHFEALD